MVPVDDWSIRSHTLDCHPVLQLGNNSLKLRHARANVLVNGTLDVARVERIDVVLPDDGDELHLGDELVETTVVIGERGLRGGESAKDDIPQLNAVRRDGSREGVIVLDEEFGEIVHEHKEDSGGCAVDGSTTDVKLA